MKKYLILFIVLFNIHSGFAQNFVYEHPGSRAEIVNEKKLVEAKYWHEVLKDKRLFADSSAIVAIEISAVCEGKTLQANDKNNSISLKQKEILNAADPNSTIIINVKFNPNHHSENTVGQANEMDYHIVAGPEKEAEFSGGEKNLSQYIQENIIDKVSEKITLLEISRISIAFTINEEGKIIQPKILRTSTIKEVDQLLFEAITKMPTWGAAETSKGIKTKQKFILTIPLKGGC